jgi:hypothetical protein
MDVKPVADGSLLTHLQGIGDSNTAAHEVRSEMPADSKADSGSPEGWEEVQADTEAKGEKVTNTEDRKAQEKTENSGSGAKTPKVEQLAVEKLDDKKPKTGVTGRDPPKLEPQQDRKIQDGTSRYSPIVQPSVGKKTRRRIKVRSRHSLLPQAMSN